MRDFDQATRAARERLDEEQLTRSERARIERAILGEPRRASLRRVSLAMGLVAAAVVAVIAYVGREQRLPGGFVVRTGRGPCIVALADGLEVPNGCAMQPLVATDGAEVLVSAGSVLVREQAELRLRRGRAEFLVSKRKAGQARFVVRVSTGSVVVTGTRFVVSQDGTQGSVSVSEGTVEMHWEDGRASTVHAGETLAWPEVAVNDEPAPTTEEPTAPVTDSLLGPGRSKKHVEPAPAPDPNKVLRQLLQLRTQNRFDEATALLREARNNRAYTIVQRERFGFELCNLVGQTGGTREACSCWHRHVRDFPTSQRDEQLPEAMRSCAK